MKQTKEQILELADRLERLRPEEAKDATILHLLSGDVAEAFGWRYVGLREGRNWWRSHKGEALVELPNFLDSYAATASLLPHPPARIRYSISTHSATPWRRANARIHSHIQDEEAEGGWAVGQAPGQEWESYGETVTIALCVAMLRLRAETFNVKRVQQPLKLKFEETSDA
jgi:hypothetical protein